MPYIAAVLATRTSRNLGPALVDLAGELGARRPHRRDALARCGGLLHEGGRSGGASVEQVLIADGGTAPGHGRAGAAALGRFGDHGQRLGFERGADHPGIEGHGEREPLEVDRRLGGVAAHGHARPQGGHVAVGSFDLGAQTEHRRELVRSHPQLDVERGQAGHRSGAALVLERRSHGDELALRSDDVERARRRSTIGPLEQLEGSKLGLVVRSHAQFRPVRHEHVLAHVVGRRLRHLGLRLGRLRRLLVALGYRGRRGPTVRLRARLGLRCSLGRVLGGRIALAADQRQYQRNPSRRSHPRNHDPTDAPRRLRLPRAQLSLAPCSSYVIRESRRSDWNTLGL